MSNYLTNTNELTDVADAIREKGGTSAALTYPAGFVSAIEAIPTGGGGVETAHVEYFPVEVCYFTDATMTVRNNAGTQIDEDLPIGSLLIDTFSLFMPMPNPTNCTLVTSYKAKNNGYLVYEVTG